MSAGRVCLMTEQMNNSFQKALVGVAPGLFMAPQSVGESLKGGQLVAAVASSCGLTATPAHTVSSVAVTPSFITALRLGSRARMLAFCAAVQAASPVGSYVTPTPGMYTTILAAASLLV